MIRIIPVLFIKNGLIVRSQFFKRHQIIGNVVSQASRLNEWNADELIYIDISRENKYDGRRDDLKVESVDSIEKIITAISKVCFMPLTFGGGIRTVKDAVHRIHSGADKITLNNLLFSENILGEIVKILGSQAVVASIDYKKNGNSAIVYSDFGQKSTNCNLIDFCKRCESLGCGEIFLQNIDLDGSARGFDLDMISNVVESVSIPVIGCAGAGNPAHFRQCCQVDGISGVAAGNYFNFVENAYPFVKNHLKKNKCNVR